MSLSSHMRYGVVDLVGKLREGAGARVLRGRRMTELIPGVGAGSLLWTELLADGRSTRIGAIHQIDYGQAVVLTHDRWKFDTGGIPQFSFLLATAQNVNDPREIGR